MDPLLDEVVEYYTVRYREDQRLAGRPHARFASTGRLDPRALDHARSLLTDGTHDPSIGFTHAYFHRVAELADECTAAGLTDITVHGVEGPAWTAAEAAVHGPAADAVFNAALDLARLYSTEPALVAASAHLLSVGTVPSR
ncbi:hypothetical protein OHA72_44145 [Dactylosporangium sp. NBC_01737]|uniref:hypothetical protein n=1 Tax=Dactylosporangium sp. NBC_01737 TaxID=2975959 RepID=UPI002E11BE85|nr:hypothetical protein OHA72_44145 [Dactylosporangium sp. NBC_01737]